jgi:hypothetical protein
MIIIDGKKPIIMQYPVLGNYDPDPADYYEIKGLSYQLGQKERVTGKRFIL